MSSEQPIGREILRDSMIESLRTEPPTQFLTFQSNTAKVLAARGLPTASVRAGNAPHLRAVDERRFREILWSLINSGILVQGMNASNPQWPFISLTELGEDYVKHGGADVYDPDNYLRQLDEQHPLDQVEQRFLRQAVGAFHANLPDAAAVMLGAASEHVVQLMCEAIGQADTTMAAKVKKLGDQPALRVLEFVHKYIEDRKGALERSLREEVSTTFAGVGSMIRVSRNSAGHPAFAEVDRDQAFVLLRLYPHFRSWAHRVIESLPI